MRASSFRYVACVGLVLLALPNLVVADVLNMPSGVTSLELVAVDNPGNTGELSGAGLGGYGPDRVCGAVGYAYRMGRFEVTAGQYCEFLNAVAAADTYGLYNPVMALTDPPGYADNSCRILRSGTPGSYTYSVAADWANRPVNYVSWGDAARFANWLTNGQPTGAQGPSTTEDGAYYLNGAVTNEALLGVTRKPNARYVIPTEDEWYKAAYHKNDGATGNYWVYTTATDTLPSNVLGDPTDPGNNATFLCTDPYTLTIGRPYYRTEVGAHEHSESPYGTFDQGGNVYEWNETLIGDSYPLSHRGLRGGSYIDLADYSLPATCRIGGEPTLEGKAFGFRIAEVPEPASLWLLALAAFGLAQWRRGS